jgi:hypothetical protein
MRNLFKIETDRATLTWSVRREETILPVYSTNFPPPGYLRITRRRQGAIFESQNWRSEVPSGAATDWQQTAGPRIFEERDYLFHLRSKNNQKVSLINRDPILVNADPSEDAISLHGVVNFGSQVGVTSFSVAVGGTPEFDFELEIFPSKIDYASDFEQLTAEVQDVCTGLALEYLRSTFKSGLGSQNDTSSVLEWTVLLKNKIGELEKAINYIALHPHWNVEREPEAVRAGKLRKIDTSVRRAIIRGSGSGGFIRGKSTFPYREKLNERTAHPSLDTAEHRWLAHQVKGIRRRLSQIIFEQAQGSSKRGSNGQRRENIRNEVLELERRVARLSEIERLKSAGPIPPTNFASMKLLGSPGYREAYRAIMTLGMGLRLAGGPIQLSLKALSTLYEYWCYIAVLRIVSELVGLPMPTASLIKPEHNGLRVALQKGRETVVKFSLQNGRRVSVTYNPLFKGDQSFLVPQQPDILLTIEDPSWPALHIVLDAKYRLDNSPDMVARYKSSAPPQDALNVLHRYRDAIVETVGSDKPTRTIVEAIALFPYRELEPGSFRESRLLQSLQKIGVGAIPMLPNSTSYFTDYLARILIKGGWSLAELGVNHRSREHAIDWREAAARPVLVAVLKAGYEAEHLSWIETEKTYYMPMFRRQRRQYQVSSILIFSPSSLRTPGAITHIAKVESIEVLPRKEIKTPWPTSRDADQSQVVYRLSSPQKVQKPISMRKGSSLRISQPRWTSELGFRRATVINELILETEPEWRLYENLQFANIKFEIEAASPNLENPEDPRGRAWFRIGGASVQYRGSAGFLIRKLGTPDQFLGSAEAVVAFVLSVQSK